MKIIIISILALCLFHDSFGNPPSPRKKVNTKTKVIGGGSTTSLTYQALLSANPTNLCDQNFMQGGGVLITPNCILTAKHVLQGVRVEGLCKHGWG
jgi:V8-like Glu-specific endopeptidase